MKGNNSMRRTQVRGCARASRAAAPCPRRPSRGTQRDQQQRERERAGRPAELRGWLLWLSPTSTCHRPLAPGKRKGKRWLKKPLNLKTSSPRKDWSTVDSDLTPTNMRRVCKFNGFRMSALHFIQSIQAHQLHSTRAPQYNHKTFTAFSFLKKQTRLKPLTCRSGILKRPSPLAILTGRSSCALWRACATRSAPRWRSGGRSRGSLGTCRRDPECLRDSRRPDSASPRSSP